MGAPHARRGYCTTRNASRSPSRVRRLFVTEFGHELLLRWRGGNAAPRRFREAGDD
jgi:hypothetical protein